MSWHFVRSPEAITLFVGTVGGFLGPLYGILVTDYYLVKRRPIEVADLLSESRSGPFWYTGGWNLRAVAALAPAAGVSATVSFAPTFAFLGPWNWFLSGAVAALIYLGLQTRAGGRGR